MWEGDAPAEPLSLLGRSKRPASTELVAPLAPAPALVIRREGLGVRGRCGVTRLKSRIGFASATKDLK